MPVGKCLHPPGGCAAFPLPLFSALRLFVLPPVPWIARLLGAAEARAAYQDFLTLWKDADPDIPILKEAKAEYAKLQ
jgi:hypothetical protein